MKITEVEAEIWRIPFAGEVRPAWSPGTVWREKSTTVYRVTTDAGLTGIGGAGFTANRAGSDQSETDRSGPICDREDFPDRGQLGRWRGRGPDRMRNRDGAMGSHRQSRKSPALQTLGS